MVAKRQMSAKMFSHLYLFPVLSIFAVTPSSVKTHEWAQPVQIDTTWPAFTSSKPTLETEQCVKSVQN